MKFLVFLAPPSIYHGCSTRKTFWEENFTGKKQDLFVYVNMRNCGKRNVRKHKEIKDSDERVTLKMNKILKISEKFDNLDNGNHIFRVKSKNRGTRRVVGKRSVSQEQSKVDKI